MGYVRQVSKPAAEPVDVDDAKLFCRVSITDDDEMIAGLIAAARELAEVFTGKCLAQRTFVQVLDSHPYYTDTVQSQLAYPPSYYSLPRYSTTLWNYSQMIKLPYPPCISVESMIYVGTDGAIHTLNQDTDFILDRTTEPARIFPKPGQYWPADLYVANAVEINFTAGYDPDPEKIDDHQVGQSAPNQNQQQESKLAIGIPQSLRTAILMMVSYWYDNRGAVSKDNMRELPLAVQSLLYANAAIDFAPTRG